MNASLPPRKSNAPNRVADPAFHGLRDLGHCSSLFPLGLAAKPSHRNSQTVGDGDKFVVHEVSGSVFDTRNGGLIQTHTSCGQLAGEVVLGEGRTVPQPGFANSSPGRVFEYGLFRSFHGKWHPTGRVQQNGEGKVCGLRITLAFLFAF